MFYNVFTMKAMEISNVCKKFFVKIDDKENDKSLKFCKRIFSKYYDKIVLHNCSFSVDEGSIFGLVGLNGIGKTTLIKIIFDMMDMDSGKAKFFGINHYDPSSRINVSYLPEKFSPSQYLSGYEFLEISLSFFKKKLDKSKAKQVAEMIDLDPVALKNIIGKYSKGMGQKLGILSCLLSEARLLVLDEPMTGLDPKSRIALKNTLKDYVKNGNSIFFSSHILSDIDEICDKMAVLHDGNTKFIGTPKQFRDKYDTDNAEVAFLKCIYSHN